MVFNHQTDKHNIVKINCKNMNKNVSNDTIININNQRKLKLFSDDNPPLARIVISGAWSQRHYDAKKLLEEVIEAWPENKKVEFLITCGGFIDFPWPNDLQLNKPDTINPDNEIINALCDSAEPVIHKVIDKNIRNKLKGLTNYVTLGLDSSNPQRYSVELVAVINTGNGKIHWTGKSYPNNDQEKSLIRINDMSTHFMNSKSGKVMVLGCHDLKMFSNRGRAVSKSEWRINARNELDTLLIEENPKIVIQHPHSTDSTRSWGTEIKQLCNQVDSIENFLSAGRYYRGSEKIRSPLSDVLNSTKIGQSIDFVYESN